MKHLFRYYSNDRPEPCIDKYLKFCGSVKNTVNPLIAYIQMVLSGLSNLSQFANLCMLSKNMPTEHQHFGTMVLAYRHHRLQIRQFLVLEVSRALWLANWVTIRYLFYETFCNHPEKGGTNETKNRVCLLQSMLTLHSYGSISWNDGKENNARHLCKSFLAKFCPMISYPWAEWIPPISVLNNFIKNEM